MKRILALLACLLLFNYLAYPQQRVKGLVIDAQSREPLIGVSIRDIQSKTGDITKVDGTFSININNKSDSLLISYAGYQSKKLPVNKNNLIIFLHAAPASLNELVVTASRAVQRRTEAPVALGVISSKMMRETKPVTLDQVLNKISGVNMIDLGNEQHTMAIRQPIGYRSNFLYLQDGIPIRTIGDFNHNALIEINQAAVKRIEVIKGPSSALYGSDAVGGVVNFITKKPAALPDAKLTLEGSSWGYRRTDITASNIFNHTGVMLSGYYANQHNGYMQHSDFHKLALTARVDQQISEKAKLTGTVTGINYYTDQTGGLDSTHFFDKNYQSFYTFTYRKVKALRARLSWEQQWNKHQYSSLTFYYRNNIVGQNPSYRIKATDDPSHANGEVNKNYFQSYGLLAQHSWKFKTWDTHLLAGLHAEVSPAGFMAHYINIQRNGAGYFTTFTKTDSLLTDYKVTLLNAAAYFRIQTSPLPHLRFVAGLRYDRLDYNFNNHLPSSAFTGAPDGRSHFRQLTPKVGMTYDFGKDRGSYANYSIGFAPPDMSDLYYGVKIPYLKSARYFNYELGGWISFDHHKGYADVSLYRMNGRNEIVSVRLADGSYIKKNAGHTLHYGIEYTVKYKPVSQWKIRLSGTNVRHVFKDYIDGNKNYSGKEMNGAPHWIASAQVSYYPAILKGMDASVEWQHLSSYYMDPDNTKRYPGYDVFNVRINYTWKRFEFWLHLINAANTLYATTAEKNAYGITYHPGLLRTLYLGIGYHLNFSDHNENNSHKN